jgi:hypothetical protein
LRLCSGTHVPHFAQLTNFLHDRLGLNRLSRPAAESFTHGFIDRQISTPEAICFDNETL